jgi:Raf kinase inhibitor-like YbhB/YbcL family protein
MEIKTSSSQLEIISPVFRDGQPIPPQYSGRGQNINPPLNIFNVPAKTQSLGLIMHDPDAPNGDFLHWLVWDIPPSTESIAVNSVPVGAMQGKNGMGQACYLGPAPPQGTGSHRYVFDVYALDTTLDLPAGSKLEDVKRSMDSHVLEQCSLAGTFSND